MRPTRVLTALAAIATTVVLTSTVPASAATTAAVSHAPAPWTPTLASSGTDGSLEQVRELVQCNNTTYAVGRFTAIDQGGSSYLRDNAFSFSAETGAVTGWNPRINGKVDSIAISADGSTAYLEERSPLWWHASDQHRFGEHVNSGGQHRVLAICRTPRTPTRAA